MRNLCLTAALALAGCAAFDAPTPQALIVPAGSSVCYGTPGSCEALDRIARELSTPAMVAAICAAGADAPECRK